MARQTTQQGIADFTARMTRLSERALHAAREALAEEAQVALEEADRDVPVGATGKLKASGKIEAANGGLTVFVKYGGKKAPHAHLVEFGHRQVNAKGEQTGTVAGKPFLTPAGENARRRIAPRLAAILKEADL
jgi:hypothetical protein